MGPSGIGYPSSLPALQDAAARRGGALPTLVVGAAQNGDIVPAEANWRRFVGAAAAGGARVWELVLREAGHLQVRERSECVCVCVRIGFCGGGVGVGGGGRGWAAASLGQHGVGHNSNSPADTCRFAVRVRAWVCPPPSSLQLLAASCPAALRESTRC